MPQRVHIHSFEEYWVWNKSHFTLKTNNTELIFLFKHIFWALLDNVWKDVLEEMPILFWNFKPNYKMFLLKSILRLPSNSKFGYILKPGKIWKQVMSLRALQKHSLSLHAPCSPCPPCFLQLWLSLILPSWPTSTNTTNSPWELVQRKSSPSSWDHPVPGNLIVDELGCFHFNIHVVDIVYTI